MTVEIKKQGVVGTSCNWALPRGLVRTDKGAPNLCAIEAALSSNDVTRFSVEVDGKSVEGTVPADFVIVSMGDSFASGEGNPDKARSFGGDVSSVVWMNQRCHRSMWSGPIRAAIHRSRQWSSDDTNGSSARGAYTILSTACSGAEIPNLYAPDYPGRETIEQMKTAYESQIDDYPRLKPKHIEFAPIRRIDSQIDQIRTLLESSNRRFASKPVIDALIVSSGGNDVNFGPLVASLVTTRNILKDDKDKDDKDKDDKEVDKYVKHDIGRLTERYKRFQDEIKKFWIGQVYLTEYPDPTTTAKSAEKTTYCNCEGGRFLGMGLIEQLFLCISEAENGAASTSIVQPLNQKLRELSREYGWYMITGIESKAIGHAWCQDRDGENARWFRTFSDSVDLQATLPGTALLSTGAMHPTANGHEAIYKPAIESAFTYRANLQFSIAPAPQRGAANTFIQPTVTIAWEGDIHVADACRSPAAKACSDEEERIGVAYPQVVRRTSEGTYEPCPYQESGPGCSLQSIDVAAKRLSVTLHEDGKNEQLIQVRARDRDKLKIHDFQDLGQFIVDGTPPETECRLVHGDKSRRCMRSFGWERGDDLQLMVTGSDSISGIGSWTINGREVTDHIVNERLVITGLASGEHSLSIKATDKAGNASVHNISLKIDADPPEIADVQILGYRFEPSEAVSLLSSKKAVSITYTAIDVGAGLPWSSGHLAQPTCNERKSGGRPEAKMSLRLPLSASDVTTTDLEVTDCAKPTGNTTKRPVTVVRPLANDSRAKPLNASEWLVEMERNPQQRDTLLALVRQLSPRLANPSSISDADLPLLAAWLNLASGRVNPDTKVEALPIICGTSDRRTPNTVFSRVKAVDACLAVARLEDKGRMQLLRMMSSAYVAPKAPASTTRNYASRTTRIQTTMR